ncbi:lipid storage droplets surface-binding protein 2-like [Ctenocephalides felis]|uniref:lipid storage droplets surface-binding protein 2-like n=1 Tax=Ctenocephalides felis TaxID=7515 RepID=UPI000E6E2076|nr:lipid storage droplets surface-binding protein 2-like [Ctenocephalides felis]
MYAAVSKTNEVQSATSSTNGFVGRMLQLPGIESALQQSQNVYGFIKASSCVSSALLKAEKVTSIVIAPSQNQHSTKAITDNADTAIIVASNQTHLKSIKEFGKSKVLSLKELSWRKTNEVLSSSYGLKALKGIDYASGILEGVLDSYLPLSENDSKADYKIPPAEEDGLAHAVQTLGKICRQLVLRVHNKVNLEKNELHNYMSSLTVYEILSEYVDRIYKRKSYKNQ